MKTYKPRTPSLRHRRRVDTKQIQNSGSGVGRLLKQRNQQLYSQIQASCFHRLVKTLAIQTGSLRNVHSLAKKKKDRSHSVSARELRLQLRGRWSRRLYNRSSSSVTTNNHTFIKLQKKTGSAGSGGRNNLGRITVRRRGGENRWLHRHIDKRRNFLYIPSMEYGNIKTAAGTLSYDPRRSAYLRSIQYYRLVYRHEIASTSVSRPKHVEVYDHKTGPALQHVGSLRQSGDRSYLKDFPHGSMVNNVELQPGFGSSLLRSAGTYGFIMAKIPSRREEKVSRSEITKTEFSSRLSITSGYVILKLSSGCLYKVSGESMASLGRVSNLQHKQRSLGKAGTSRREGKRPSVRGVAMNPVDHPHGGRTSRGKPTSTPWGLPTKGYKTGSKRKHRHFRKSRAHLYGPTASTSASGLDLSTGLLPRTGGLSFS